MQVFDILYFTKNRVNNMIINNSRLNQIVLSLKMENPTVCARIHTMQQFYAS